MAEIVSNSVLPANREAIELTTSDGLKLVGELALPIATDPKATLLLLHPNPTGGGMTPAEPAIGSTMTAAILDASCSAITSLNSSARAAPVSGWLVYEIAAK